MNYTNFFTILLLAGISFLFIGAYTIPLPSKVEYRYLPRTLDEQMRDVAFQKDIYEPIFDDEDVWYRSVTQEKIN